MIRTALFAIGLTSCSVALAMDGTQPGRDARLAQEEAAKNAVIPKAELDAIAALYNEIGTARNAEANLTPALGAKVAAFNDAAGQASAQAIAARDAKNRKGFDAARLKVKAAHDGACALLTGC
jgi:hypothetical protein